MLFAALLSTSLLASAPAMTPAERIAKGEAELSSLDYDAAADDLLAAAEDPSATEEELVKANLLAGIANRIIGHEVEARLNFRTVLLRHPDAQLPPDMPPKVTQFFALVRQEVAAERGAPTTPTKTPALTTTPVPAPPAATETPTATPWFMIGGGLVVTGAAAVVAASCEAALDGDGHSAYSDRSTVQNVGRGAIAFALVGAVAAGAGGVWLAAAPP